MFGLILALIYGGYLSLTNHPNPEIFASVTNFMFYWYAVWAAIDGTIALVFSAIIPLVTGAMAGAAASDSRSGTGVTIAAAGLGGLGGAGLALLIVAMCLFNAALTVGGVYLISTSLVSGAGAVMVWDNTRLLSGGILFLLVIVTSRGSSSNHSRS